MIDAPVAQSDSDTTQRTCRFQRNLHLGAQLFARKGFGQVGLRELAAAMGVSVGALYHHFDSKEQLLCELIQAHYACLHGIVSSWERSSCGSRQAALRGCLAQVLGACNEDPSGFVLATRDIDYLDDGLQKNLHIPRARIFRSLTLLMPGRKPHGSNQQTFIKCFENVPLWLRGVDPAVAAFTFGGFLALAYVDARKHA